MATEPIHSLISPSYLKQILCCSKSLPRDAEAVDDTNSAALAGTAQHAYLNYLLANHFGLPTDDIEVSNLTGEELEEVDEVFLKALEEYAFLKKRYAQVDVILEEKILLDSFIPNSWGYVDICYIGHKKKRGTDGKYSNTTIYVLDAKFGRVEVNVVDSAKHLNPQLTAYWSGIYEKVKNDHNVSKGYLMILQPKLNNYPSITAKAETFLNYNMKDVIVPSATEALNDTGTYNPSLDNCKYCKNSKHCKFHNIITMAKLQMLENPEMLSDEYIEENILPNITNLKKYCDNVFDYAIKKAEAGKKWKGFTLGTARPSRIFTDEEQVKSVAKVNGIEGLITESVLSPAQAKKLLGKDKFSSLLGELVTYKQGKVTLVADAPLKKASKKDLIKDFKENN